MLLLRVERLLGRGLFLLPLVDEHIQPQLLACQHVEVAGEPDVCGTDVFAHAQQLIEVAGQRFGLRSHFRDHGTEHDRSPHGLQRVFRAHHQRGRRLPADTLQSGEDLDNDGAALLQRRLDNLLPFVERLELCLRHINARLDVADVSGTVDELFIERRAIGVDRLDFALEFYLRVQRRPLLGTGRVEFLIVLPEHVGCRLCRCGRG